MKRAKHLGKPSLARALANARTDAGLTQKEVASAADTNKCNACLWEDFEAPHAPSTLHVKQMALEARPVALALVRDQADAIDAAVIERPEIIEDSIEARAARVVLECLEVPRALHERRADGVDTLPELENELSKTRRLVATLLEHEAHLAREISRALRGQGG